jgi:epidermal growth factor receptor substrate 15
MFFSDSGLPSEVLAQIWDLANIRRIDQLNRDEFAVAMYLIRNQRGKPQSDLPTELPPNYIPPSMRGALKSTVAAPYPGTAPIPAPIPVQSPPKSNTEDLFGLDAFTSSPTIDQHGTGGSTARMAASDPFEAKPASPSSPQNFSIPRSGGGHFKSFAPQSAFGQSLTAQSTGASGTSSSTPNVNIKKSTPMDDLLGDNDPEISKKLTSDTAELANMSNQIGTLTTQMRAVQNKKNVTESELASTSTQKRDLELRLSQFRNQYEQEAKALKSLEDQLAATRKEVNNIQQQMGAIEGSYHDVQTRRHEAQVALDQEQRQSASFKERLRHLTTETNVERAQIEKLNSELRHEKGMGSIYKKQVEKGEEELSRLRSESSSLSRGQEPGRPQATRELTSASAVSPAGSTNSTNPFFRRPSPQSSVDNTMNPAGFQRTTSQDTNKFDSIFGTAFATPQSTAPPTSFRPDTFSTNQSGPSIRSSEPDVPTPSTSPPLSAYQESPQPPAPPASRQKTSREIQHGESGHDNASASTSVRVETPISRYDINTPTNAASSPATPALDRTDTTRSNKTSTGAAMFDRPGNASSPVASITSNASKPASRAPDQGDFFRNMSSSKDMPGSFPGETPLQPDLTGDSAFTDRSKESGKRPEAPMPPRTDPFSFPTQSRSNTGNKGDIDAAFASVGKAPARQGSSANGAPGDPVAKFNSDFPPIAVKKDEFPPIAVKEDDSEESDSDHGFDDDFTKASPQVKKDLAAERSHPSASLEDSDDFFKPRFPQGGASTSVESPSITAGASDFGGPLTASSQSPEKSFASPANVSQGAALFGPSSASKSTSAAPTSTFSASPPETNRTSNVPSDTYQSAVSHQSSTDKDFFPAEQSKTSFADDFDSGFDDLVDAKEVDDRAEEDLMFGSHHHDDEFNSNFDSPSMSKSNTLADRTPTSKVGFAADDSFGDFESNFDKSLQQSSSKGSHDWDAMMKGVGVDHRDKFDENNPAFAGPVFPEAPEPPKLARAISEGTEHDDPILKRLTGMGYPRPKALGALEMFDYDLQKVSFINTENCYGNLLTSLSRLAITLPLRTKLLPCRLSSEDDLFSIVQNVQFATQNNMKVDSAKVVPVGRTVPSF